MRVAVASGKGGTGKTTVATSLALAWGDATLLDCDVEGPNADLLLHPEMTGSQPVTVKVPRLRDDRCDLCGKCALFCRSNALAVMPQGWKVFDESCHSCGGCRLVCPTGAIIEEDRRVGEVRFGRRDAISFTQGILDVGEVHAVPVIDRVLESATGSGDVIIDSPPGASCPMIAAARSADVVVLVVEPTPFGLHDAQLAAEALRAISRPVGLVVNRVEWGKDEARRFGESNGLPLLLEIPHRRDIAMGFASGRPLAESAPDLIPGLALLRSRLDDMAKGEAA